MTELEPSSGHAEFLSLIPRLQAHAPFRLPHLNTADREQAIADVVAYGFASFLRLRQRGKDPTAFPAVFAHFVAQAVYNGRGIVRRLSTRDLLAARSRRERITVNRL